MSQSERKPFVDWYDECAERVYKFLYSKVNSLAEAQDLTSQTFLKAWQAYPTLRDPDRFIPWIFTIARNQANDHYRQHKHMEVLLDEFAPDPQANPVQIAIQKERSQELSKLISILNEDDRELLYLRYQGEITFREIAQVLGRSESAVKKQHLRLLARLQSQLEPEND
ncbi:MAG: sigma-70 family RNA polymerase sigma factor [Anaerolineaceae bacterium]